MWKHLNYFGWFLGTLLLLSPIVSPQLIPAHAQLTMSGVGGGFGTSVGGGCSQATTALARLDGAQNTSALTTMICGMVTDGTYALLDGLWITTINSTGNSLVNLATSSSYNLTVGAAGTFTANAGVAGNGTTTYYNTNFTPSTATSPNFTQNSASVGVCLLNSNTGTGTNAVLGMASTPFANYTYLVPNNSTSTALYDINDASFPGATQSSTNVQGSWIISRTGATAIALYENGISIGSTTSASAAVATVPMYLFAYNNAGGAAQFAAVTIGYAFIGGALTGTQVSNLYSRLHTYIQAVDPGGGC